MTKPKNREPALPRLMFSVPEVADSVGLSEDEVYKLCQSGDLPARRVGRRVLIRRVDLEAWIGTEIRS